MAQLFSGLDYIANIARSTSDLQINIIVPQSESTKPASLEGGDAMFPPDCDWAVSCAVAGICFYPAALCCLRARRASETCQCPADSTSWKVSSHWKPERARQPTASRPYCCGDGGDVRSHDSLSVTKREWRWCGNTVTREGTKGCPVASMSRDSLSSFRLSVRAQSSNPSLMQACGNKNGDSSD